MFGPDRREQDLVEIAAMDTDSRHAQLFADVADVDIAEHLAFCGLAAGDVNDRAKAQHFLSNAKDGQRPHRVAPQRQAGAESAYFGGTLKNLDGVADLA